MAIAALVMYRLWRMRRECLHKRPDLANIATSLWFAMLAYLGTAVFLHLSYQRYWWIIVAVAGAALQVYQHELIEEDDHQTAPKEPDLMPGPQNLKLAPAGTNGIE